MVFAYTAILKAVAVDVVEGRGLIQVPNAGNNSVNNKGGQS